MKTIVFFDKWLSALRQIDSIVEVLSAEHNVIFLSLDVLHNRYISNDLNKSNKASYNSRIYKDKFYYKITDISQYGNSIFSFFEIEKPDIAITISLHNLDHRWFNLVCQFNNVPVYLIMHGIKGESVFIKQKKNIFSFNTIKRLLFYNRLYLLYYRDKQKLTVKNKSSFQEWKQLIFDHNNYKYSPKDSYNVKYKKLFVTNKSDITFYKSHYPTLLDSEFHIIGTLDLIEILKETKECNYNDKKNALFLGQPLDPFIPTNTYVKYLEKISTVCKMENINIIFRPHPRESSEIVNIFYNKGIEVSCKSLSQDFESALFVVGFTSTALLTALSLKIPTVSFVIKKMPHPEFLFNDEISIVLNSVDDFNSIIIENIRRFSTVQHTYVKNPIDLIIENINEINNLI